MNSDGAGNEGNSRERDEHRRGDQLPSRQIAQRIATCGGDTPGGVGRGEVKAQFSTSQRSMSQQRAVHRSKSRSLLENLRSCSIWHGRSVSDICIANEIDTCKRVHAMPPETRKPKATYSTCRIRHHIFRHVHSSTDMHCPGKR